MYISTRFNNRHHYSSRHFIIPVIVYTLLYNLPKFLEFTTACAGDIPLSNFTAFNETEHSSMRKRENSSFELNSRNSCTWEELRIVARSIRSESTKCKTFDSTSVCNPILFLSRTNYWYVNVYILGFNTMFNIILPILSLIILNVIILR